MVAQAAQQLWLRGAIAGDGGLITGELTRRRYIVTPARRRRADLPAEQLQCVDLGGVDIARERDVPKGLWWPHRVAYQVAMGVTADGSSSSASSPPVIRSTIAATPPYTVVLANLHGGHDAIRFPSHPDVPILPPAGEDQLRVVLQDASIAFIKGIGVFVTAPALPTALNKLEQLELACQIALITRQYRKAGLAEG